jgi:hypothetical protein
MVDNETDLSVLGTVQAQSVVLTTSQIQDATDIDPERPTVPVIVYSMWCSALRRLSCDGVWSPVGWNKTDYGR